MAFFKKTLKNNGALSQNYICITNWGKLMLRIGAFLLQTRENVVTNWGNFFITNWGQVLLQIEAKCITNWGRYYKLGQLLQIGA